MTGILRTTSFAAKRMRKCAVKTCRKPFAKRSMAHKACSIECAVALARESRLAAERKADKVKRDKLKTRSDHMKAAQVAFNRFIRERDKNELCICCDKPLAGDQIGGGFDCGHYRSVGSAPHLRFAHKNAHGQTKQCNRWGAGRAVDYRIGLIKRIGLESVEALEADCTPRKYTIADLIAIKAEYRQKLRELQNA